jgi:copper chaperone CopZ
MAALVRQHTLDNTVNRITTPGAAKSRFPAPSYVHHVPGRLRIKAPEFRENPSILEAARRELATLPGVSSVSPNRLTGSILVEYDPPVLTPAALVQAMQECGFPGIALRASPPGDTDQGFSTERLAGAVVRSLFDCLVERLVVGAIAAVI